MNAKEIGPIWRVLRPDEDAECFASYERTKRFQYNFELVKYVPESHYAPLLAACKRLVQLELEWACVHQPCPACNGYESHAADCVFKAIYEAYGKVQGTETEQ